MAAPKSIGSFYDLLNRRLDPRDPWDAACLARTKEILGRELELQAAEKAKATETADP